MIRVKPVFLPVFGRILLFAATNDERLLQANFKNRFELKNATDRF